MIPGISDIYEFSDWLKKNYIGPNRNKFLVNPLDGGLIEIIELESVVKSEK